MQTLAPSSIQVIEKQLFAEGISASALMEEASAQMARAIQEWHPIPGVCLAVFGKGHNGGDALVIARILSQKGWEVVLFPAFPSNSLAPLTSEKWNTAGLCNTLPITSLESWNPDPARPLIVLDGLLGIGASGKLQPPIAQATKAINALRQRSHAKVFAIDIPTGLNGLTGEAEENTIIADATLTVAFAKPGLLADGAANWTGSLHGVPLTLLESRASESKQTNLQLITSQFLTSDWPRRKAESHKGTYGRVALVAGSKGTVGAAILAAKGALRSGAGLVSLWVPENVYICAVAGAPAECMVQSYNSASDIDLSTATALGIGPGVGFDHADSILSLIANFEGPAVVDADALTMIASQLEVLGKCRGARILTPHPGEMRRLVPETERLTRKELAEQFVEKWPVTLLLKGARTVIADRAYPLAFNSTGCPGMASGGMGDVLTGVCTGLLAQGSKPRHAACMAAWLCGKTAELLVSRGLRTNETLLAGDIADSLTLGFDSLHRHI